MLYPIRGKDIYGKNHTLGDQIHPQSNGKHSHQLINVRWTCHVRGACFSRTILPERSPHPLGNYCRITSMSKLPRLTVLSSISWYPLVFQFTTDARGDRMKGFQHGRRCWCWCLFPACAIPFWGLSESLYFSHPRNQKRPTSRPTKWLCQYRTYF